MRKDDNANGKQADEQYLQDLSALLDGELGDHEDVLNRAACDGECRDSWQRYHLIRDVLQKEHHLALPDNFASMVSAKIALEDDLSAPGADVVSFADARDRRESARPRNQNQSQSRAAPRWLPYAGLGLAASVAAAGFIGWQVLNSSQTDPAESITVAGVVETPVAPAAADAGGLVRTVYRGDSGTSWVPVSGERDARVEQRLNSMLLNHLEDSRMTRVQGIVAHSRVVGYDSEVVNESF